jgi:hypothetical protein
MMGLGEAQVDDALLEVSFQTLHRRGYRSLNLAMRSRPRLRAAAWVGARNTCCTSPFIFDCIRRGKLSTPRGFRRRARARDARVPGRHQPCGQSCTAICTVGPAYGTSGAKPTRGGNGRHIAGQRASGFRWTSRTSVSSAMTNGMPRTRDSLRHPRRISEPPKAIVGADHHQECPRSTC